MGLYPRLYEYAGWHYPGYIYWSNYCCNHIGADYYRWSGFDWSEERKQWQRELMLHDYGANPFVINIEEATEQNRNFRTALWTGSHLQVVLMSLNAGEEIGLEVHPQHDQFLRIEEGKALVQMGSTQDNLYFQQHVEEDYVILVPAGTWHNVINTGNKPLKLYTIYGPPAHPFGTIHETKAIAMAAEEAHS